MFLPCVDTSDGFSEGFKMLVCLEVGKLDALDKFTVGILLEIVKPVGKSDKSPALLGLAFN